MSSPETFGQAIANYPLLHWAWHSDTLFWSAVIIFNVYFIYALVKRIQLNKKLLKAK